MKLESIINEAIVGDKIIGYHATSSFHQVCDIFERGFLDHKKLGHLCFSLTKRQAKGWANDLGGSPYVIKCVIDREKTGRHDRRETCVKHADIKPMEWGIITGAWPEASTDVSSLGIKWLGNDPASFDISKLNGPEFNPHVQNRLRQDSDQNLSREDQITLAVLGKTYAYGYIDNLDPADVKRVSKIIMNADRILVAFKESGMSLADFQTVFIHLLENWKWSGVEWDQFVEFKR